MSAENIISSALQTIEIETASVQGLAKFIDAQFVQVVQTIHACKGRLVVSGVGKSAIIAQKIVATLNSTGTPSVFLHAADAIHGDLGMVQPNDIVLLISKSGDSPEIKVLVPLIKNFGNILIAMVGNLQSFLAKQANMVLNTTIEQEACPNNLAPTSSTTAQMVMGDALAVSLMKLNDFDSNDFARYHPGGMLGKKLYLRVSDVIAQNEKPAVTTMSSIKEIIVEMTKKRLGATVVLDNKTVVGIITDGDLRRMLERGFNNDITAKDIMSSNPKTIEADALAVDALQKLKQFDITQLIVLQNNQYAGMLHLHDLLREGLL